MRPEASVTRILLLLLPLLLPATAPAAAQASRLVILVRHAETTNDPPRDPPLSEAGRARAEALAETLRHARIGAIFVTGFARTQMTAAPTAEMHGVTPTIVEVRGGLERHVAEVASAVRALPVNEVVLVVGHSNTIPAIAAALGGPPQRDLCHGEYERLFVLELPRGAGARLLLARYGAADPPDACPAE